ncbi:MAG: NifB/NifX family molybdenum-iron cluster-binding protein [Pseudomonadota bacterium]
MSIPSLTDQESCRSCQPTKATTVVHLPVAPQVVARTRFSPPTPVRSECLMVPEAIVQLDAVMKERGESISMVAITGPGDPLANPEITLQTVRAVRQRYPAMKIGLKTLGLGSEQLAGELARAGVNYVEMLVDGIKSEILEKIYAWIRPGMKTLKVCEAVDLLIREQRNGVPALKFHNIEVTILTTLYPGINIDHVPKISSAMMVLGAGGMALIPYAPEPGTEVDLQCPDKETVRAITEKARTSLPIALPLLLGQQDGVAMGSALQTKPLPRPTVKRPNVAVASSNGIEIDLHLGQAIKLLIYGPRQDGLACLLETRDAPEPGTGANRWSELAVILHDCFVILAASAGETPRRALAEAGIAVLIAEDNIEGTVDVLFGGGKKGKKGKKL